MTSIENVDQHSAFLPQCVGPHTNPGAATASALALPAHHANDPGSSDLLHPTDTLTQLQHHCLLIEAAEEIEVDWPGFFDWKPSMIARTVGLSIFLVAALVSFSILCWEGLGYILNTVWLLTLK